MEKNVAERVIVGSFLCHVIPYRSRFHTLFSTVVIFTSGQEEIGAALKLLEGSIFSIIFLCGDVNTVIANI